MAKKFEIIDSALVVTDTVSGVILHEYPKRDCWFLSKNLIDEGELFIYDTGSVNARSSELFRCELSEAVDSALTPFTDSTWRDFARTNLAFSNGGGSAGSGWDGQVEFRSDLPVTIGSPAIGEIYLVEKKTSILFGAYTTYQSGLYIKDLDTGSLSDWRKLNVKVNFTDSEFAVVSASDESKRSKFDLSLYTTATTRVITWPDKDITPAGLDDIPLVLMERIIVNQLNVATTLGGLIDSTKDYFIDGVIDMAGVSIEVPATGLFLSGYNSDSSQLVNTEDNYTMFNKPVVGGSGNMLFKSFAIEVSGTNSRVYNLLGDNGFEALETNAINYNNCASRGEINNYRQGLDENLGIFGGTPNLILSGTWIGGYRITTAIVRGLDDAWTGSLYEEGTSFLMNSRFLTDANVDLGALCSFVDFNTSNFASSSLFQLSNCLISRNGFFDASDSNITPNIEAKDLVSNFKGNQGVLNTFEGITADLTSEVQTVISSTGIYVDLLGTYTTSDEQHFESTVNGEWINLGDNPVEFNVNLSYVIDGGANDAIELAVFKSDGITETFVKSQMRTVNNVQGGNDVAFFNLITSVYLFQNEFILLKVRNNSDTTNITAEIGSYTTIYKR